MQSIHLRNSCFGSESRPSSPPLSGNLLHGRPWWSRDVQLGSISAGYWDSKTKKKIVETTIYLTSWWSNVDLCYSSFSAKAIFLFYTWNPCLLIFECGGNYSKGWHSNCLSPTLNVFDRPPISICTKQKSKQKVKMVHWYLHPPKLNNSPLKNDSLKTRLSFWGPAYFQGRTIKLPGSSWLVIEHFLRNTLRLLEGNTFVN